MASLPEECQLKAIRPGQSTVSVCVKGRGHRGLAEWRGPCLRVWYGGERFCACRLLGRAAILVFWLMLSQCLCLNSPQNSVWLRFINCLLLEFFIQYFWIINWPLWIATTGKEAADKEEGTVVRESGPSSMKGKVEIIIYWDNYYVSGTIFKWFSFLISSNLLCSAQ